MIYSVTARNYLGEEVKITLNEDQPEHGLLLFSMTGLGPAKATINTTDLVTSDGGLYNSARLDKRNIVIKFRFTGFIEETRKLTYKYFPIKKDVTLFIETDTHTLRTVGYVETNEPDIFSDKEGCTISIICPDPYFYIAGTNYSRISGIEELFEFPFEANYTGAYLYDYLEDSEALTRENCLTTWDLNTRILLGDPEDGQYDINYISIRPDYTSEERRGLYIKGNVLEGMAPQRYKLSFHEYNVKGYQQMDRLEPGNYIIYDGRDHDNITSKYKFYLLVEVQLDDPLIDHVPIASSYIDPDSEYDYLKTNKFTITGEEKGVYIYLFAELDAESTFDFALYPEIRGIANTPEEYDHVIYDTWARAIESTEVLRYEFTEPIEFGKIIKRPSASIMYNGDANIGVKITFLFKGVVGNLAIYNAGSKQRMNIYVDRLGENIQNGDRIIITTTKGNKGCYFVRGRTKKNILYCLDDNPNWIYLVKGLNIFTYKADHNSERVIITIENDTIYEGV